MNRFRQDPSQLSGEFFLTDAGLETDLIFNHGVEIPHFAAHTLLETAAGRAALARYFRGFLGLAKSLGVGFVLDTQTWRASPHWAKTLGTAPAELAQVNRNAVDFSAELREEYAQNVGPIILNGLIGPHGDAYAPQTLLSADQAQRYHAEQIGWLAETQIELLSALTFTQSDEAIGVVRAACEVGLPIVVSFTVETDGKLPTGQALGDAIRAVDDATDEGAAYFMINCAHPNHFEAVLSGEWLRRVRGMRCNASRCSHAELDEAETLDDGDPVELGLLYQGLAKKMPWMNVFGGCCGSDLRHVRQIATALVA